jgi:hypothetical protein
MIEMSSGRKTKPAKAVAEERAAMSHEERRTRSLEEIADSLERMRGSIADIGIWIAHIGRNMPTGRNH